MRYLYIHPLFDERKCAHRFSYCLERAFAEHQLHLERFDYQGTGESEGRFCDVTMESLRSDLLIKIKNDTVCLIGTRFGAAMALDMCRRSDSMVKQLVLIEPIVDGMRYVQHLLRKQRLKDIMTGHDSLLMDDEDFCNVEGYMTHRRFIDQIKQVYHLNGDSKKLYVGSVLIIQISASRKIEVDYERLAGHLQANRISTTIEIFNLPAFWERIPDGDYRCITEKIVEWHQKM